MIFFRRRTKCVWRRRKGRRQYPHGWDFFCET